MPHKWRDGCTQFVQQFDQFIFDSGNSPICYETDTSERLAKIEKALCFLQSVESYDSWRWIRN